jgi:hypothetical protein
MAKVKQAPLEVVGEQLAEEIEGRVRRERGVAKAKLLAVKVTPRARALLEERLVKAGLERTTKGMRVAVEEQLVSLLGAEGEVPLKGLSKRLALVTPKEAEAAAKVLVGSGKLVLGQRGGVRVLSSGAASWMAPEEHKALRVLVMSLDKLLKASAKVKPLAPARLARVDLSALEVALAPLVGTGAAVAVRQEKAAGVVEGDTCAAAGTVEADVLVRLRREAQALGGPQRPVYLPELLGGLTVGERAVALRAIEQGARAGDIELRPWSGLDQLSDEERSLCVLGPQGSLLSHLRFREDSR